MKFKISNIFWALLGTYLVLIFFIFFFASINNPYSFFGILLFEVPLRFVIYGFSIAALIESMRAGNFKMTILLLILITYFIFTFIAGSPLISPQLFNEYKEDFR